jgi:hypothetical protein
MSSIVHNYQKPKEHLADQTATLCLSLIANLTDSERSYVLGILTNAYCSTCGAEQKFGDCNCLNDFSIFK